MHKYSLGKQLCAALVALASISSTAAVVQQTVDSSSGDTYFAVLDFDTSLQWLSPVATRRQSIAEVLAGFGGWVPAGFRYATAAELTELLTNSGVSTNASQLAGPSGQSWSNVADVDALKTLIAGVGWTSEANPPSAGNPFGQRSVYGVLSDIFTGDGQTPPSHYYAWLGATDSIGFASIPGSQWLYSSQDPIVGSWLVREIQPTTDQSIPEPNSMWLAVAGLLGLLASQRKWPWSPRVALDPT